MIRFSDHIFIKKFFSNHIISKRLVLSFDELKVLNVFFVIYIYNPIMKFMKILSNLNINTYYAKINKYP